jgi:FkbM family methyltransferase
MERRGLEIGNYHPCMTPLLTGSPAAGGLTFGVIDVGCGGGLDDLWRALAPRLRAWGIEPQMAECARLADAEADPNVRYFPYLVGVADDHWFARKRAEEPRPEPCPEVWSRASMCLAHQARPGMPQQEGAFGEELTDGRVSLDDFVRGQGADVDFVKVDTDGADLEVLVSAEGTLAAGGVLGLLVEANFTGSGAETANTFHNIDRYLKRRGFDVYSVQGPHRYSRASLPGFFRYHFPAQTFTGQTLWGDVLYLRDGCTGNGGEFGLPPLTDEKLVKLACLYELFSLADCAAELILRRRELFARYADPERLLDALTPPLHGNRVSYHEYMAEFTKDPRQFYPPPPRPLWKRAVGRLMREVKGALGKQR